MRTFQTVMFLLAMVVVSTQTFRHIYVKWVAPTDSVLDQFQSETESKIAEARTLEELVPLYADAKAQVDKYESDPTNPQIETYQRRVTEPYQSEQKLKTEITRREARQRQVAELIFYWAAGFLSILAGLIIYHRMNKWIGISGVLVGFSEMVYWTSPLSHLFRGGEFEMLLNVKLGLSVGTLGLLVSIWLISSRYFRVENQAVDA